MMTENGLLIVFSGPSGVGKDAVLKHFLSNETGCARSVTMTTRKPRQTEEDGRDYFFVSREEFLRRLEDGKMLEHTEYNGNYYGTLRSNVEEILGEGKNVILKIDINGASQIKKIIPEAVMIFLAPPSWETLEQRLTGRGTESGEELKARLAAAKFELTKAYEYDYIIVNDFVELSSQRLSAVITAAGCSVTHRKGFIREVCDNA